MATRLIKLEDGTLVEVEVPAEAYQPIVGSLADKVDTTFDKIKPVLLKVYKPIAATFRELSQEIEVDQIEIELGLCFEYEGNLYITKTTLGANIIVRLMLKNK